MHSLAFLTGGFSIAITNYHSGASWNSISSLKCSCSVNLFSLVFFGLFLEFIKRKFHIVWPIVQNGKVQLAWGLADLVINKVICRTNLWIKKELQKKEALISQSLRLSSPGQLKLVALKQGLDHAICRRPIEPTFYFNQLLNQSREGSLDMPMPYG